MGDIYVVYLRQPKEKRDERIDAIYNKGCFGSTGCHSLNLMSPSEKEKFVVGKDRLCFMQGGSKGTKIVYITPPISEVKEVKNKEEKRIITRWDPTWDEEDKRPLKYKYGLPLKNKLARKLSPDVSKEKPDTELYQHFRTIKKPVSDPDYLMKKYEKHRNDKQKKYGNKIFVNYNYETFEFINEPEFYIHETEKHCASKCWYKHCDRREKNNSDGMSNPNKKKSRCISKNDKKVKKMKHRGC